MFFLLIRSNAFNIGQNSPNLCVMDILLWILLRKDIMHITPSGNLKSATERFG